MYSNHEERKDFGRHTKPGRMNSLWMALDGQQMTLVPRMVLSFCYSRSRCVRERFFRQRRNVQPTRLPHSMPAFIQAQYVFLSLAPFLFDPFSQFSAT